MLKPETAKRRPSQDIPPETHGLRSLWNMLILEGKSFVALLHLLMTSELMLRGKAGPLPDDVVESISEAADGMISQLKSLGLNHSIKVADNMMRNCKTAESAHRAIENLTNSVMLELDGRKYFGPQSSYEEYFERPMLFGQEVFEHFPSANTDIFEAGTCLALERGTACVMHCMRVAEVGLRTLAGSLEIERQNDWGSYIREIGKVLAQRGKEHPDDIFCAEAASMIDNVKRAWRNPTMHVDSEYSLERAEDILLATRSLMRHLATRLSEAFHVSGGPF
jgi:hypothetical protein